MSTPTLETVLHCPNLPSLPTVAVEVLELTQQANVRYEEIEQVVQHDPALAAKILKTVNSSYYGLSRPCPTIGRALTYLGLNTVKSLVLGFSLVDLTMRDTNGLDLMDYWQRSLQATAAARQAACRVGDCDPEEVFIAALMQDIGMLAMDCALGDQYARVLAEAGGDHERLCGIENEALGFNHAEAGARLAEEWGLPQQIVDPIRFHHEVELLGPGNNLIVRLVAFALQTHLAMEAGTPPEMVARLESTWSDLFDQPASEIEAIIEATRGDAAELSRYFKIDAAATANVNAVLAEAENARLEHQLRIQRQAEELEQANQQLAREASTDALTGVANRKQFDRELGARFEAVTRGGGCLGLVIADADRFKRLNDTHGHQVGDAVLVELARRMAQVVGDAGLVCRYGGEEFVVVLPDADRRAAAQTAESIRRAFESEAFALHGLEDAPATVDVTASFGVAVLEDASRRLITTPELLVQTADRALYAAKEAGRNCVRIFKPKPNASAA